MDIVTSKSLPSIPEVAEILKKEFSDHYSYELFLEEKSIFVGKSTWVKAQIYIDKNLISVTATSESIIGDIISGLCITELGVILVPLFYNKGKQLLSERTEFEKEIGLFLKHKYN
jgi:hypothetical protein